MAAEVRQIGEKDFFLWSQSMSLLLKAGLPIKDALLNCGKISGRKPLRSFCGMLAAKIDAGQTLSSCLAKVAGVPEMAVMLVGIGEEIGSLAEVFEKICVHLDGRRKVRGKVVQAAIYPAMVFVAMAAAMAVMAAVVFPNLLGIFAEISGDSGVILQRMRSMRAAMFGALLALCLILSCVALALRMRRRFALAVDGAVLRLPLVGAWVRAFCAADFAFAMRLAAEVSLPFSRSLQIASASAGNRAFGEAVKRAAEAVAAGVGISEAFRREGVFPEHLAEWVALAESTGDFSAVFARICDYSDYEKQRIVETATSLAEPALILIAGAAVAAFVCNFIVPVFAAMGDL